MASPFGIAVTDGTQITIGNTVYEYIQATNRFKNITAYGAVPTPPPSFAFAPDFPDVYPSDGDPIGLTRTSGTIDFLTATITADIAGTAYTSITANSSTSISLNPTVAAHFSLPSGIQTITVTADGVTATATIEVIY